MVTKFPPFHSERKKRSISEGTPQFLERNFRKITFKPKLPDLSFFPVQSEGPMKTQRHSREGAWERQLKYNMAANETEEVDVAREFNLLPVIFETIQALQKTNDPQEFTKKVLL